MITETGQSPRHLDVAPLDGMVFGGWDLRERQRLRGRRARRHRSGEHRSSRSKEELGGDQAVARRRLDQVPRTAWPASTWSRPRTSAKRSRILTKNIEDFKEEHNLDRVVMVNLTSTEKYHARSGRAPDARGLRGRARQGRRADQPGDEVPLRRHASSASPTVNFTPSLTKIPALEKLAEQSGMPIAGEDGKTGQTLIKTVLAPAFAVAPARRSRAGTRRTSSATTTARCSTTPRATRPRSQQAAACSTRSSATRSTDHQVHIHYYKPRGDQKEAWDNIDLVGFLGERMQLKVNFLCKDSILAAPLVARSGPPARRRQARRRARDPAAALAVLQVAVPHRGRGAGARPLQAERRCS